MGVFDLRKEFKPFEYQEVEYYKTAIQNSYWLVTKWNLISDIQDFKTKLTPSQKNIIKNTLLAISQIEVDVKRFWGKLGERFPKAEFENLGTVFSNSEVIHAEAYSFLLEKLGLNDEFIKVLSHPVIQGRVDYLSKYLKSYSTKSNQEYTLTLTLFSIFIENVSLFSQFLIVQSFWKKLGVLKDIDNIIEATRKEEMLHAMFGIYLIELIKKEYPEWFNEDFYETLRLACIKSFEAESKIIDWIFEKGELDFLPKSTVVEFIKNRFNESMLAIGGKKVFEIDEDKLKDIQWFDEDSHLQSHTDFFNKKNVTYSKYINAITVEDLFND